MTADPSFDLAPGLPNISNVHDLSNRPAPWNCSDDMNTFKPVAGSGPPPWMMAGGRYLQRFGEGGGAKAGLMFSIVGALDAAGLPPVARPFGGDADVAGVDRSDRARAAARGVGRSFGANLRGGCPTWLDCRVTR